MSAPKVGDQVQIIECSFGDEAHVGQVGLVVDLAGGIWVGIDVGPAAGSCHAVSVELVGAELPKTREVPLLEAREGDTVTLVGKVRKMVSGIAYVAVRDSDAGLFAFNIGSPDGITVTRAMVPLPTDPGAVGKATVRGLPGLRIALPPERDGRWVVLLGSSEIEVGKLIDPAEITDYEPLVNGVATPPVPAS